MIAALILLVSQMKRHILNEDPRLVVLIGEGAEGKTHYLTLAGNLARFIQSSGATWSGK